MKTLQLAACCSIGFGLLALVSVAPAQRRPEASKEYPTLLIREEQSVNVNGAREVWQLRWTTKPHDVCEPSQISLTCPCMGFAYGEAGELDLVRQRESVEFDRLHITPFFEGRVVEEGRIAVIQRWQPDYDKDFAASQQADFPVMVSRRPVVQVMHLADYDHDGQQNEFYLQTEAAPCGKSVGVIVGISKTNQRLHVFGTASNSRVWNSFQAG